MAFERSSLAPHGTMTRYRQHVYDGQKHHEIDQACKDARNEHDRKYQSTPQRRATMSKRQRIRRRALARLGQEHPDRFAELVAEEQVAEMWSEIQAEKDQS